MVVAKVKLGVKSKEEKHAAGRLWENKHLFDTEILTNSTVIILLYDNIIIWNCLCLIIVLVLDMF